MTRPKSLIKNIKITKAKRAHTCKSNRQHKILKDDLRLAVKEGQSERNYCIDCGRKFLDSSMNKLSELRSSIEPSDKIK